MANNVSLAQMIERGGVYYNIDGQNPSEVLANAVKTMDLPAAVDRDRLLAAILEREALMPTAIGNGVAIPHPRNPIISDEDLQRGVVFFLKNPINYNALDRKPVTALILIISANARSHLTILAGISHLCQREDFIEHLAAKPTKEELVAFIKKFEAEWAARNFSS